MTSTEQDKELREAICNAMHIHPEELQYSLPNSFGNSELEAIMQLITADRKRVALEARIDELKRLLHKSVCEVMIGWHHECEKQKDCPAIRKRIAELKAQQEEA